MKNVREYNVNRSAPNLLNICIDQLQQGEVQGRIYHCYQKEAVCFNTVVEMIRQSEKLFDYIAFPQASTRTRSLIEQEIPTSNRMSVRPERVVDPLTIMEEEGKLGTFITNVKFRQNAEWQGELFWVEKEEKLFFQNTLELIKQLDLALQNLKK